MTTKRKKNGNAKAAVPAITEIKGDTVAVGEDTQIYAVVPLKTDVICVAVSTYGGNPAALDIRRYTLGDDEQWHPTSRGIRIPSSEATLKLIAELATLQPFLAEQLSDA